MQPVLFLACYDLSGIAIALKVRLHEANQAVIAASEDHEGSTRTVRTPLRLEILNVSYGIFPHWRGKGLAGRALNLIEQYLREASEAIEIVLQIAPENVNSVRVAQKAGFTRLTLVELPEGRRVRYVREIHR